jgi:hypothetical protein
MMIMLRPKVTATEPLTGGDLCSVRRSEPSIVPGTPQTISRIPVEYIKLCHRGILVDFGCMLRGLTRKLTHGATTQTYEH